MTMKHSPFFILLMLCVPGLGAGEVSVPHFRATTIDSQIEIGYGITVADVDGDKKVDILLVDKKQIVWYKNPSWKKFVIAENLTEQDNVCIAATDIDVDGKAEIAVGAGWNPSDTIGSGAVFYLIPPADRTQKWEPVVLHHEPTVHRMRWLPSQHGQFELVVVPLHGRGNKAGVGDGVKILAYQKPSNPHDTWKTELVDESMHMTHNLDIAKPSAAGGSGFIIAGKEGVIQFLRTTNTWTSRKLVEKSSETAFNGAGEVRAGSLPDGKSFLATIEPMHGNELVVYTAANDAAVSYRKRQVLDSSLKEGHALACGDLLGAGYSQIVVGWRARNNEDKVGIKLFTLGDQGTDNWKQTVLDDTMACEDLCLADLNGDGKLDIIASGRATRNVKVYFNDGGN
jgi:hypothetical protein